MFLLDKKDREADTIFRSLPPSALEDSNVAFVIKVIAAIDAHNIVRFFKLVRTEATYLQACLLQRYFGEVRLEGLRVIRRAFREPGSKSPSFSFLHERLCFGSKDHTLKFLQSLKLVPVTASLTTVSLGGAHAFVDLAPITEGTKVPPGAFPLEPMLIPVQHGVCSRRQVVDGVLWALESDAPQLAKDGQGHVVRLPCSLTPAQRQRRTLVRFREQSWLSAGGQQAGPRVQSGPPVHRASSSVVAKQTGLATPAVLRSVPNSRPAAVEAPAAVHGGSMGQPLSAVVPSGRPSAPLAARQTAAAAGVHPPSQRWPQSRPLVDKPTPSAPPQQLQGGPPGTTAAPTLARPLSSGNLVGPSRDDGPSAPPPGSLQAQQPPHVFGLATPIVAPRQHSQSIATVTPPAVISFSVMPALPSSQSNTGGVGTAASTSGGQLLVQDVKKLVPPCPHQAVDEDAMRQAATVKAAADALALAQRRAADEARRLALAAQLRLRTWFRRWVEFRKLRVAKKRATWQALEAFVDPLVVQLGPESKRSTEDGNSGPPVLHERAVGLRALGSFRLPSMPACLLSCHLMSVCALKGVAFGLSLLVP